MAAQFGAGCNPVANAKGPAVGLWAGPTARSPPRGPSTRPAGRRHHDRVKVTGFEVFPVVCPPPFRGGRSWLFVRLDAGHETRGYGEMMLLGAGFRLPVLAAMVADIIEQAVIGHDPYRLAPLLSPARCGAARD